MRGSRASSAGGPVCLGCPVRPALGNHDYADDLDLHGHASLLHLAGVCGTAPGWTTLDSWLLTPADPETIALRQEAVREMAGAFDFRDRLAAEARLMEADSTREMEGFLRWCESGSWLSGRAWLRAAAIVLPPVNLATIVLYIPWDGARRRRCLATSCISAGARASVEGDQPSLL